MTSPSPNLTSKDAAVLQALFDAESSPSPSSSTVVIDPSLPSFPAIPECDLDTLKTRELNAIREIQQEEGSSNTSSSVEAAIAELDALIAEFPAYPSAYVNRAQALRVLIESQKSSRESQVEDGGKGEEDDNSLFSPTNTALATRLFSDLGQAIALATPPVQEGKYQVTVSPAQARILADAYTHRGYLLLKAAKRKKTQTKDTQEGPEQLWSIHGKDQLEEMASRDFFFGGQYGNKVAQQLAVQTNPYAKMCGAIVKEALRKEVEGHAL